MRFQWGTAIWVFPKTGVPQNGWFIRENLIKMDDLAVFPYFLGWHPYGQTKLMKVTPINACRLVVLFVNYWFCLKKATTWIFTVPNPKNDCVCVCVCLCVCFTFLRLSSSGFWLHGWLKKVWVSKVPTRKKYGWAVGLWIIYAPPPKKNERIRPLKKGPFHFRTFQSSSTPTIDFQEICLVLRRLFVDSSKFGEICVFNAPKDVPGKKTGKRPFCLGTLLWTLLVPCLKSYQFLLFKFYKLPECWVFVGDKNLQEPKGSTIQQLLWKMKPKLVFNHIKNASPTLNK